MITLGPYSCMPARLELGRGSCHSPLHPDTEANGSVACGPPCATDLCCSFFLFSMSGQLCSFTVLTRPCSPMCKRRTHFTDRDPCSCADSTFEPWRTGRLWPLSEPEFPHVKVRHIFTYVIYNIALMYTWDQTESTQSCGCIQWMLNKCSFSSLLLVTGHEFTTLATIPTMFLHLLTESLHLSHQIHSHSNV